MQDAPFNSINKSPHLWYSVITFGACNRRCNKFSDEVLFKKSVAQSTHGWSFIAAGQNTQQGSRVGWGQCIIYSASSIFWHEVIVHVLDVEGAGVMGVCYGI